MINPIKKKKKKILKKKKKKIMEKKIKKLIRYVHEKESKKNDYKQILL